MKPCPECGELVPYRMVQTGWHYQVAGISFAKGALHKRTCPLVANRTATPNAGASGKL